MITDDFITLPPPLPPPSLSLGKIWAWPSKWLVKNWQLILMLPSYLHHRFIARFLDSITISSEFATYSGSCNPIKFGRGGRVGGGVESGWMRVDLISIFSLLCCREIEMNPVASGRDQICLTVLSAD